MTKEIFVIVAFIPTLRKTYYHPKSETALLYGTNVLRHSLVLGALGSYNIATMLHSIAMIITNSIMVVFIKTWKNKTKNAVDLKVTKSSI